MLEGILRFSIEHRFLIVLLSVGAAAFGVHSLLELPLDAVPDITNRQVQINTVVPGLSPVEVEKLVTFPIETALSGIPGLDHTRSLSRNGFCQVTAVFEDDVDLYFARQQVSERIGAAQGSLPPGAVPVMGPVSTGLGEVYMWSVRYAHPRGEGAQGSDGSPGWQSSGTYLTPDGHVLWTDVELEGYLRTVQDWIIRPQIKSVDGIAAVEAIGGHVKTFVVQPEPSKLRALGLTLGEIIAALEENNVSTGAGYIEPGEEALVVRSDGRIGHIGEIGDIILGSREGTPIFIRDVATVEIGRELRTGSATQEGREVVVATALMLVGGNSRTVARAVDEKMAEVRRLLPPDIEAPTALNRTKLVNATIRTVGWNLAEGAILVVVVLLLLLGNVRAAILTSLAIPFSMLMTATGMVQSRISGNLMSLGAIDFGLIVDGAVIIVENCMRHLAGKQHELGRPPNLSERLEAVLAASKQVLGATVFGQAIIMIVYFPILALTGIEGKMFHPMALTVIFALAGAFLLSLTFIPAMVAIVLAGRVSEHEVFLVRWAKALYARVLGFALEQRLGVISFAAVAFVGAAALFQRLGQEFVPTLDETDLAIHAMRVPSVSLTQSTRMQLQVERALGALPEVATVFSKTGTAEMASDPMAPNVSDTFVILKPRAEWPDPARTRLALVEEMEAALVRLPGQQYEFTQPIQMRFNELIAGVRGDVAVKIYGDDLDRMRRTGEEIARVLGRIPGAADVKVEQSHGLPMMDITIDRSRIARRGLNVAEVQDVVATAIGGRSAGLVFEGDRRFEIVVRLAEDLRRDVDVLASLPVALPHHEEEGRVEGDSVTATRSFVPLDEVATIEVSEGPNQVSRENGKRRLVVQANVRDRDIASFVEEAEAAIAADVKIPPGQWLDWGGQFENLVAARRRLTLVVPICLFLIFLLLFGTFGSVRQALLVFTGVPLALTGGVVALWLRGIPFSISAGVGFIALSGVAVLNGLVMVTFINQLRKEGLSLAEAVFRGSMVRLRPILMTALVASLGFVPMALATGTGAEVQRPLATVVIGGLVSSTLLTLVVLPALYRVFEREATEGA
ncbi:MAG: CusA/CzcA family heavy metal efflux RND transporter [Planctomycetota bacterium]